MAPDNTNMVNTCFNSVTKIGFSETTNLVN